jgi:type IV pilus assembly protein PilM
MSALALDIGTYSIKAISGTPGAVVGIKRVAEVFNSTGIAVPTDEATMEKLGGILEAMIRDYSLPRTDVRLSLPETVVSTKVISIPPLSDAELASAIGWQAEQHIPIPPEELSLQYQVLYRPPRGEKAMMRVMLVGTRKRLVERYVEMLNNLGIEPSIIETQVLSVVRSLQFEAADPTTMVAHLGAASMNLGIVHQGELQFVLSHMNGGQLLTKTLEQGVGLDPTQAEQYKRTYGLDETQFQGKVRQTLLPAVQMLVNEMRKAAQFFVSQNHQGAVHRIVLSGGATLLPGLVQYITAEIGAEVLVAAPFTRITGQVPDTINQPGMSVCMGLLMREH